MKMLNKTKNDNEKKCFKLVIKIKYYIKIFNT